MVCHDGTFLIQKVLRIRVMRWQELEIILFIWYNRGFSQPSSRTYPPPSDQFPKVNFGGIAIGDGWFHPIRQVPSYPQYAWEVFFFQLLTIVSIPILVIIWSIWVSFLWIVQWCWNNKNPKQNAKIIKVFKSSFVVVSFANYQSLHLRPQLRNWPHWPQSIHQVHGLGFRVQPSGTRLFY